MNTSSFDLAIEELAAVIVMADANDPESIDSVRRGLEKLHEGLSASGASSDLSALAVECIALEKRLGLFGSEADTEALNALSEAIGRLQSSAVKAAHKAKAAQAKASQTSAPKPASAPEKASQPAAPQPNLAPPPAVVAQAPAPPPPAPPAPQVVPVPVETAPAPIAAFAPQRVSRDEETVGLVGEFLSESEEGLSRADQILINSERGGVGAEAVNGLFRVFHTVKGVAGFLELVEITTLAHTTETMLNRCREGTLKLADQRLDAVFDATAMVRRMLGELRTAVQESMQFTTQENLGELLQRLRTLTEDGTPAPAAPQPVAPPPPTQAVVFNSSGPPDEPSTPAASLDSPPLAATPSVPEIGAAKGNSLHQTTNLPALPGTVPEGEAVRNSRADGGGVPGGEAIGGTKLRETVKVDLERVDNLVAMVGELVVVESMVVNAPEIAKSASARVRNCLSQLAKVTRDLQDVSMRMRMLPVSGVFQKMARMSRDLGRKSNKQLRLILSGEATEMDRSMVEHIADPLVHMIRNAVDHGLETPEERHKVGKPQEGTIRLSAYHEGGSIVIELSDDGRGLDRDAILNKARAQGLVGPNDTLSETDIHMLIFAPGFSTAKQVTEVSGRGVGMDVVKRNVDAIRGRVSIKTTPGQGTTFKILLPLTLAIIDGMLVACGKDRYIIPTLSIVESIQPNKGMLVTFADQHEMINIRGQILPLVRLGRLFNSPDAKTDPTQALVVIIEGVGRRLGLLVDEVVTQQQVVIKSLGQGLGPTRYLSGAAILADGRVGLIVNVEEIAGTIVERRQWTANESSAVAS
jgi:two-component system, chemotaxis family, sensor kinase CheA